MSATLTWRPGDDVARQLVAAVDMDNIVASANATAASLGGDADEHMFTGLTPGVSYTYIVIGYDASGSARDASDNVTGAVVME